MDPDRLGVLIPALLGMTASILSGCLGGVGGYILAGHKEQIRRDMYRGAQEFRYRIRQLLEGHIGITEGVKVVKLLPGADLRGVDLVNRRLEGVDLQYANLEGANLQGINLQGAKLVKVKLSGGNLRGANLLGADLQGADLQYAMLRDAELDSANLLGANLQGAILSRASLRGANLERANLSGADLLQAHLGWARLDDRTAMPEGWEDVVVGRPEGEPLPRFIH